MSAPQIKERPASMLRAMFAGFGSLMSVMDKVRSKPAAEAPAAATTPAPEDTAATEAEATAAPSTDVAEAATEPEATAGPEAPAEPQATAVPTASAAPETPAAPESPAGPQTSGALPLASYDDLSVASLRARLRNLSNDDLTLLMTYEREHQNRPEVVKMFQNRLIKMTSGFPKLEA
jgi:hypothetical protein